MKSFFRITLGSLLMLIACLALLLGSWHLSHSQSIVEEVNRMSGFRGMLLAASDADMLATAYANGVLNKQAGIEDSLSLIGFVAGKPSLVSQVMASNSVISWPSIVDWNSDKHYAYVAETRAVYKGEADQLANVYADFPPGRLVTVIDYRVVGSPLVVQQLAIGENIQSVSLNARQDLLVAGSTETGKEIVIAQLKDGLIDTAYYFSNDEVEQVADGNSGVRTIEFHPTQNIMAVNLNNTSLAFYQISINDEELSLEQLGTSLRVAKRWSVGNWHPSGKYFLLSDVAWGNGNLGAVFNGRGKLVSVAFDEGGNHRIQSEVKVGLSPEGFDLSPNGEYAIAVNMGRTYVPANFSFVPARKRASLSLISIDAATGNLEVLGKEYGFRGALPEDAVFDSESNSIAVAIYQEQDELQPRRGCLEFWEVENGELVKTNQRVWLTRGVHNLKLIEHKK